MPTNLTGRAPISFTQTPYDSDITYDSNIRYDWLIINNTQWNWRARVYSNTVMPVLESGYWDDTKLWSDMKLWSDTALYGTPLSWRPLI